jgi:hypothetical protein
LIEPAGQTFVFACPQIYLVDASPKVEMAASNRDKEYGLLSICVLPPIAEVPSTCQQDIDVLQIPFT